MAGYFSDYPSYGGPKGLPSPADTPYETPYETPGFIRSKRSSRATSFTRSREASSSPPPPLPSDGRQLSESRDGQFSGMDPRRFTPTLHASLVSEILNLRRELDSKNHLVENLETNLSTTKTENESLTETVSQNAKEIRKAKQQVQYAEHGTFDAVDDLAKERDDAKSSLEELKAKLEAAQKTTRRQDQDAVRTQQIWESEKESWDNERRQLERRVHVTESRLRAFVEGFSAQQAAAETKQAQREFPDDTTFKDSGFGNESDTASIASRTSRKHRRNMSSISFPSRNLRDSASTFQAGTPERQSRPMGNTLADELDIEEEDEYDEEDDEEDLDYGDHLRQTLGSRNSSISGDGEKAKRILGLTGDSSESPLPSPQTKAMRKTSIESVTQSEPRKLSHEQTASLATVASETPRVEYVDSGYQPSPPPSPKQSPEALEKVPIPTILEPEPDKDSSVDEAENVPRRDLELSPKVDGSPISPPDTPVADGLPQKTSAPQPVYATASSQTDPPSSERPATASSKRSSLSPPMFVPSIAIHPPSSRPSTPRTHVLPPGTKSASTQTQAVPAVPSRSTGVQTEEIRVDTRPAKLPVIVPKSTLLPSPTLEESQQQVSRSSEQAAKVPTRREDLSGGTAKTFTAQSSHRPSASQSSQADSPETSRKAAHKDNRAQPLRAIPLPKPVLAPAASQSETGDGPLNRSSQYGVGNVGKGTSQLLDVDDHSDTSDLDGSESIFDTNDLMPIPSKPPQGRFGLSEPPKAVPEDKEISPERRPGSADSQVAAPAPSVSSTRAPSQQSRSTKPPSKLGSFRDGRPPSRSPSFGSMASGLSTTSASAPYPIPTRSSSRFTATTNSEGSQSPTPQKSEFTRDGSFRSNRTHLSRQPTLRKSQSANTLRQAARKQSPQKHRRRRRSPDLTPVQSMAFDPDSPAPTQFPIPELPTPLQEGNPFEYGHASTTKGSTTKGSTDMSKASDAGTSSAPAAPPEHVLVDAIASTMVGEWMWKYVRKRKSFGMQEDPPVAPDGSVSSTHGTRHKRWVWLSPYERTIMWDSKQPATGTALLGKKGRKLAIQSVIDVEDETPLPKGSDLTTGHSRSIVIVTPARALKFTATNPEKHAMWMAALSFLAQSNRLPTDVPPMPTGPPPPVPMQRPPQPPNKPARPTPFGKSTVRDSVRLARGKRPALLKAASQPDPMPPVPTPTTAKSDPTHAPRGKNSSNKNNADADDSDPGAAFPTVPRLYISTGRHQRKRSNTTSPRLAAPLQGLRSLSSSALPTNSSSNKSAWSSRRGSNAPTSPSHPGTDGRSGGSGSGSGGNFFEAVPGEMRMEAFVDPNVRDGVLYVPAPPGVGAGAGRKGHGREGSWVSQQRGVGGGMGMGMAGGRGRGREWVVDEFGRDPFGSF